MCKSQGGLTANVKLHFSERLSTFKVRAVPFNIFPGAVGGVRNGASYDNQMNGAAGSKFDNVIYDNTAKRGLSNAGGAIPKDNSQFDAFDMRK